nr:putative B3 domain-containing protein At5g58280 [Tanacetum cinerariifolium]
MAEETKTNSYEEARKQQLLENKKRFEELGILKISRNLSDLSKSEKKSKQREVKPKIRNAEIVEPRRSTRARNPIISYQDEVDIGLPNVRRRSKSDASWTSYIVRPLEECRLASYEKRVQAIKSAEKLQSNLQSDYPSFVKSMVRSHVYSCFWLGLPQSFCRAHLPKSTVNMVLEDEDGNETEAVFISSRTGLSGGWRAFALEHKIDDGDALVFELIEQRRFKNSKRPLFDSSKSKDSKEAMKNSMRLRDFDYSSKEDVKGKEKYSNGLIFDECGKDDANCNSTELRVSEMDDNIRVEREVGTENIGLKSYGESGKEDVDGLRLMKQESVSSKALKESNNNDLNIKLLDNEKATTREFLSGHSKMFEEETFKVADQKEKKESSVKGNKMFLNKSVDSDTVDSEFMVMEVDEFQDCVNGGEMDYVFEGNIGRLADEHERNFRGNNNGLPDTRWKNVGKGKCNKLVENKDEYGGEQYGSKEDNDLIVSDLVLRKCYDGRYFEDQVGGYKSFNVFPYDSDVHNPSTKVVTCEDELYRNERKTKNSEMGSAILKLDIWKWPKMKKPRYTNYNSKSRRWKNGVRLFNPKTLLDAYCLAKLQEFTHNDMIKNSKRPLFDSSKSKDSKEVVKNSMSTELRVSEMDDNIGVEREVGTENIGLKSYGEFGKEDVDVELKEKNKCLEVTNNFASEKYGIEDKNKRMGFSSLVYGGEIIDGANSCDMNKSNVRSSANETGKSREFLSGHSKMFEEETFKVADEKLKKESSVKGNKMFLNESVYSDTVDSEFMVMEVDEFQDCVNGGEMDYVFEGNIGRLADEHERNFRGNNNGLPDTRWKNVGKGKRNKLVENKDEYGGEQDGSKEDNDLIVSDLVLRKCYDGRYFEDQVGGYKSLNVFAYDSDVHNPSTK